jgi:serine/threonine protein kinase
MSALKKPIPFGKYYLLERINVGGMAEVFKAKTFGVEGFERLLAVKRILPNIAEDEEFITMFIDEAKIAVQLQHANIAQIFDLGKVDDSYFIALEFVNGRDMRSIFDRMRSRGESVPIPMACYVIMQVCEGLDYAHNKRDGQGRELHLVHRDISPQNVLIGYEGEVKLIDFGIAKAAGKAGKTQAGILKGKFGYMSPEQVRGLPIDRRSDVFAVGIVLYELLTGERLFIGESDFSTLEKVRNVEIMPPSSYNKKIPQELERLVLKALARDPEDRYQNAIDLHDDLQSFLYSVGEFYSRKDLAAWMKKTFAIEIEEDSAKLEQFRQVAAPVLASASGSAEVSRRVAASGLPAGRGGTVAPMRPHVVKATGPGQSAMGWDDEELDTQIFDKEPPDDDEAEQKTIRADDNFFEDEDRTVANEPPPDILEQARPPEALLTPKPVPITVTPEPSEEIRLTPSPAAEKPAGALPTGKPGKHPTARRPTLVGVPPAGWPLPPGRTATPSAPPPPPAPAMPQAAPLPVAAAPTGRTALRRSGHNLPPATLPPAPPRAATPVVGFAPPTEAPFGTGSFVEPAAQVKKRSNGVAVALGVVAVAVLGGGAFWYYSTNRPGRIELTTVPADAVVLIDNVKVGDHSPFSIPKPAGPYALSVTRDGYVRNDQNVEVRAGQPSTLSVALEPSPDTGFELTSEPPGGLVWLDGNAITGPNGQARTDFRAFRIPPGHHVLEIKGENRFKPWRQDVEIEPGQIRKIHAMLIPAGGGGGAVAAAPEPKPAPPAASAHEAAPSGGTTIATGPSASGGGSESAPAPAPRARRERAAASSASAASADPFADEGASSAVAAAPSGRKRRAKEAPPAADDSSAGAAADDSPRESARAAKSADSSGGDCAITVNSVPWSEVWIDGKNTSKHTPVVDYKVSCGKHKIAFKRSDLQIDQTESFTVRSGETFKQRYTLATDE